MFITPTTVERLMKMKPYGLYQPMNALNDYTRECIQEFAQKYNHSDWIRSFTHRTLQRLSLDVLVYAIKYPAPFSLGETKKLIESMYSTYIDDIQQFTEQFIDFWTQKELFVVNKEGLSPNGTWMGYLAGIEASYTNSPLSVDIDFLKMCLSGRGDHIGMYLGSDMLSGSEMFVWTLQKEGDINTSAAIASMLKNVDWVPQNNRDLFMSLRTAYDLFQMGQKLQIPNHPPLSVLSINNYQVLRALTGYNNPDTFVFSMYALEHVAHTVFTHFLNTNGDATPLNAVYSLLEALMDESKTSWEDMKTSSAKWVDHWVTNGLFSIEGESLVTTHPSWVAYLAAQHVSGKEWGDNSESDDNTLTIENTLEQSLDSIQEISKSVKMGRQQTGMEIFVFQLHGFGSMYDLVHTKSYLGNMDWNTAYMPKFRVPTPSTF